MSELLEDVGVVTIGRNEGERLKRCLRSLTGKVACMVYVDSGSSDDSVAFARSLGVEVVELDMSKPFSMARGRNAGAQRLLEMNPHLAFIQFVDGDCEVDARWIPTARQYLSEHPEVWVVCGRRRERHPENSIYNRLCDIEWNTPAGPAKACGGDALMCTHAFQSVGGFEESLIAGEEPELCLRMRKAGGNIQRLDVEMTLHDANILHFKAWWKRSLRGGYGACDVLTRLSGKYPPEEIPFASLVRSAPVWSVYWLLFTLLPGLVHPLGFLPGFVDSHGHTYLIGLQASTAGLLPPPDGEGRDIASLQALLKDWAENNREIVEKIGWIAGFGYDNAQLAEQRHPTRDDLDKVSTDIPVLIIHQSGHLGLGNSKALEIAGISADTEDPKGGVFRRRQGSREPDGVCEEYAFFMLMANLASNFDNPINDMLVVKGAELRASFGYTTAQEGRAAGMGLEAMERVANAGNLPIDLVAYPDVLEVENPQPTLTYKNGYRVGGVKLTIDGSPQGKTAWLTEPYFIPPAGQPAAYAGYPAIDERTTFAAVEKAYAHGWQILCHANGDAASDRYIAAIRQAKENHPDVENRPVLIHGQVLREDQVDAIKALNIFPSLFPMHTYYWGDYHRDSVLGPERAPNISPTGWVLARGMMFGSHHDAPVALPDSMRILSATVTRKTRTGKVLGPEHRVPVATALKALTIWPAWQHFEEDSKGSIEVGKLADLVVLSENPLSIDEDNLADIKILETIKAGKSIYRRPPESSAISSPAVFGTARGPFDDALCDDHPLPGIQPVCGDGCLSHGLTMMLRAIEYGTRNLQGRKNSFGCLQ